MNEALNKDLKDSENSTKEAKWIKGLALFSELSAWIIGPLILAIIIGKELDAKFAASPWLLFLSIAIAFIVSMFGLAKKAIIEIKKLK